MATASSRSRITASASRVSAFSTRRGWLPGAKRKLRSGIGASSVPQRNLDAALGRRSRHQFVVPALDVGIVFEIDLMPLVAPGPAEDGEVGDRDFVAGGVFRL